MTSPTVPATPVIRIQITGDQVMVNNSEVEHDGSRSLYEVAIHAAAERVAGPLGRPVRAEASDDVATTRLVIHPDGHASDIEVVPEAPALAAVPAPAPVSGARGRRVLVGAAVAGSLAAGVLVGTVFNRPSPQAVPAPSPATVTATVTVTPAPVTVRPAPVPVRRSVRVKAAATGKQLKFRVSLKSGPTPARVVLTATKKGRPSIRREVAMKKRAIRITLKNVPAGTYRWKVSVDDAKAITGKTRVKGSKKKPAETKKGER